MFGWAMEEEAKLEFTITVNWRREDGSIATTQLGTLDRGACRSAEDVGLQLADAKSSSRAATRDCGQQTIAAILRSCAAVSRCHRRPLEGLSVPPLRYGVLGGSGCTPLVLMAAVNVVKDSLPLRYLNC
jgi:hypothetical protein